MMKHSFNLKQPLLTGAALGLVFCAGPAFAQDSSQSDEATSDTKNRTYLDLGAGLGYGTNPLLRPGSNRDSGFVRVSAYLRHERMTERAATVLSAYAENNSYFRREGSKQLFSLTGAHRYRASETVTVYADLGLTADFGGQLVGRIYGEPEVVYTVPESDLLPPPVTVLDPGTVFVDTRQYRVNGQLGASFALSEVDSINVAAGANFAFFDNDGGSRDYHSFFQTVGYNRQLNERSSIGAQVSFQEIDYPGSANAFIINPALVYRTALAEGWTATLSGGVLIEKQDTGFTKDTDVSPSFSAVVCQLREFSRLCLRASHTVQPGGTQSSINTTSVGANYYQEVSADTSFRLSASYSRYNNSFAGSSSGMSHFYTAAGSVSHRVTDRFFVEGQLGIRKLDPPGLSVNTDVQATVSVKYRVGDL